MRSFLHFERKVILWLIWDEVVYELRAWSGRRLSYGSEWRAINLICHFPSLRHKF
jgi:hypothetical protein